MTPRVSARQLAFGAVLTAQQAQQRGAVGHGRAAGGARFDGLVERRDHAMALHRVRGLVRPPAFAHPAGDDAQLGLFTLTRPRKTNTGAARDAGAQHAALHAAASAARFWQTHRPRFLLGRAARFFGAAITAAAEELGQADAAAVDAQLSTPDLRDKFIIGASSTYAAGTSGGNKDHFHKGFGDGGDLRAAIGSAYNQPTTIQFTSTGLAVNPNDDASENGTYTIGASAGYYTVVGQPYSHYTKVLGYTSYPYTGTQGKTGSAVAGSLPPYYALAYIMKL